MNDIDQSEWTLPNDTNTHERNNKSHIFFDAFMCSNSASMCFGKKGKGKDVSSGWKLCKTVQTERTGTNMHNQTHITRQSLQLAVTLGYHCPNHSRGDKEASQSCCRITAVTADVSPGKELECARLGCKLPEPSRSLAYNCKQRNQGGLGLSASLMCCHEFSKSQSQTEDSKWG